MAVTLLALTLVLAVQAIRVLFPLAFELGERVGFTTAGQYVLAVFALSPLAAAPVRRLLGDRGAMVLAVGGLVAARLALQVLRPVPLWLALAATVLALVALTVEIAWLRRPEGAGTAPVVLGLLTGLVLDTALRAAFRTWDPAWQSGVAAWAVTLIVAVAVLLALWRALARPAREGGPAGGALALAALGPFLALQLPFLQSPAFVASQGEVSLSAATAAVLIGNALALAAVAWVGGRAMSGNSGLVAGVLLVLLAALLRTVAGPAVLIVVVAAHAVAGGLLVLALVRTAEVSRSGWRTALGMAGAGFLFLLLTLLHQIHYDVPLPVSNAVLPPVAAGLLALGALRGGRPRAALAPARRLAAVPAALLAVPLALSLVTPGPQATAGDGRSFRLVSYNVHLGVNLEGQVDPESIARVIEAQRPDVVVLQEVSRGWVISSMLDLGEWLSVRLRMPYVYAPAADGQYGNAILSRLPVVEERVVSLPQAGGTMVRSYAWTVLDLGDGETANVIGTHLHDREQDVATRLEQIRVLLEGWGGASRTVIAGDMNAQPGSAEIARFDEAGLVSAQVATGNDLPTWPSDQPEQHIDYVFATPDLAFSAFDRPLSTASDHLALVVTVSLA